MEINLILPSHADGIGSLPSLHEMTSPWMRNVYVKQTTKDRPLEKALSKPSVDASSAGRSFDGPPPAQNASGPLALSCFAAFASLPSHKGRLGSRSPPPYHQARHCSRLVSRFPLPFHSPSHSKPSSNIFAEQKSGWVESLRRKSRSCSRKLGSSMKVRRIVSWDGPTRYSLRLWMRKSYIQLRHGQNMNTQHISTPAAGRSGPPQCSTY
ncbi:hypothetical protein BKA70DRAFT_96952 [Coprinopsis sp. MPI-PUGE-AT-0042]|nr:hypothetical protein BKA70DRAFT_96952 [Coprinopsis sp. MPI-PUGE-AT-0042]